MNYQKTNKHKGIFLNHAGFRQLKKASNKHHETVLILNFTKSSGNRCHSRHGKEKKKEDENIKGEDFYIRGHICLSKNSPKESHLERYLMQK